MLSKGHTVQIWNRTASKCAPLVDNGARLATTPAEAVDGAARVHLVLRADDAVDSVIEQLRPKLGVGTPVIDHSTNLPQRVAPRFTALRKAGIRYLHAPVFMSPTNARNATGLMLVAGPKGDFEALQPSLESMTGRVVYLGERPDKAAIIKITGNGMLVMLSAAMGDLFRLGNANNIAPEEILSLFQRFSPTPAGMGTRILNSTDAPVGFELTMARKDVQLMIDAAGGPDNLTMLPVVAAAMDAAIEAGRGSEDFTAMFRPS